MAYWILLNDPKIGPEHIIDCMIAAQMYQDNFRSWVLPFGEPIHYTTGNFAGQNVFAFSANEPNIARFVNSAVGKIREVVPEFEPHFYAMGQHSQRNPAKQELNMQDPLGIEGMLGSLGL